MFAAVAPRILADANKADNDGRRTEVLNSAPDASGCALPIGEPYRLHDREQDVAHAGFTGSTHSALAARAARNCNSPSRLKRDGERQQARVPNCTMAGACHLTAAPGPPQPPPWRARLATACRLLSRHQRGKPRATHTLYTLALAKLRPQSGGLQGVGRVPLKPAR